MNTSEELATEEEIKEIRNPVYELKPEPDIDFDQTVQQLLQATRAAILDGA